MIREVIGVTADAKRKQLLARDVMTRNICVVHPEARINEIANALIIHGVSAVPVVANGRKIVGIISEGDLFRRWELGTDRCREGIRDVLLNVDRLANNYLRCHAMRARDIMSKKVVSVSERIPISDIADLLDRHHIKRVPVTHAGKLVGVVSRTDLIRALAVYPDNTKMPGTPRRIRDAFFRRLSSQKWTLGTSVKVLVKDGAVELVGTAATDAQAKALGAMAESIPGVKTVKNHIATRLLPSLI
jgi:CBS domain-containing protein